MVGDSVLVPIVIAFSVVLKKYPLGDERFVATFTKIEARKESAIVVPLPVLVWCLAHSPDIRCKLRIFSEDALWFRIKRLIKSGYVRGRQVMHQHDPSRPRYMNYWNIPGLNC